MPNPTKNQKKTKITTNKACRNINLDIEAEQRRSFAVRSEDVNGEDRCVEMSFSSETPVRRWFGFEVLSHEPGDVDLSRLRNKAPFLMDHNPRDQRGVIEDANLDGKKGRAKARLSTSDKGEELLTDIRDEIRPKISVGYELVELIDYWVDEDENEYYKFRWMPYEISSVSIEADTAVGIGRSKPVETANKRKFELVRGNHTVDEDVIETQEDLEPESSQERNKTTPATPSNGGGNGEDVTNERQRCTEIMALGRQFGMEKDADKAIQENTSLDEFRAQVLKNVRTNKEGTRSTDMDLGLTSEDKNRYSLANAIKANISGNWRKAGFERAVSTALAEKNGKDARGFFVNYEVLGGLGRAQDTKTEAAGGALVANELHSEQFIALLRPYSLAATLGVRFMTGLVGNVDIPKLLRGSSFYWIDEGDDAPETNVSFGVVKMKPNTVAGAVPLTRRLLQQSTPDVDMVIRDDMLQGLGLAIDKAIFVGTGVGNEPLGIVNQTGVNAVDLNALGLSHTGMVNFETAIENADVMTSNIRYACNATTKGTLKVTPRNANSERYLWEDNEVNGYMAYMMKWLQNDAVLAGDFSQAMFGTWGVLDMMVDKTTKAASGGTVLRVFQDGDVACRHAKAFAYGRKTI